MIKKKNARIRMSNLKDNGVKIKCAYCLSKESCSTRKFKEKSEALGIKTYCTLTPNKVKSKKERSC